MTGFENGTPVFAPPGPFRDQTVNGRERNGEERLIIDSQAKILIVDDLPENRLVLDSILRELGENIIAASSGRDALRRLLENDFAVILLDINMAEMDGFETAALIRQRKRSEHTPIIFITSFTDDTHASKGYSLGAVDYISTPVIPEVLRTKVAVFVELYKSKLQVERHAAEAIALAREQVARAAAEEAQRRSMFLAETSSILSQSLDSKNLLSGLATAVLGSLADVLAVTTNDEVQQRLSTTTFSYHSSSEKVEESTIDQDDLQPWLAGALVRVMDTGQTEHRSMEHELVSPESNGHRRAREITLADQVPIGIAHAAIVPLHARGRRIGAFSLFRVDASHHFEPSDVSLLEDLAGRVAMALDNARLYRDIQESDRRKNEFLSMLAHELRNPLAPIKNAVGIQRSLALEDERFQWSVNVIDRQVEHMVRLVDDLLDVSRITRGVIQLVKTAENIADIVAAAIEISRPLLDAKEQQLMIHLPSSPVYVQGDRARLAQILANLLNNATKYTEAGGQIAIAVVQKDTGLEVSIRDSGIGIPPEMLARIFDLFIQVDCSLDRAQGGLGIGLTLVKTLVALHGGTVHASSEGLGQGSEFIVTLPVSSIVDPANAGEPSPLPPTKLEQPRRVLVVDDSIDSATTLAMLLKLSDCQVQVAHDGPAAIAAAKSYRPDIIMLDIGLPGMSGYELARHLRSEPDFQSTLLIAITGYGQEEDRRKSKAAGFDHHLVKPVDYEALLALLTQPEVLCKDGQRAS